MLEQKNNAGKAVGGIGALLAALLAGLGRFADDVGRGVMNCADDVGRATSSFSDDFGRGAGRFGDDVGLSFQGADDALRQPAFGHNIGGESPMVEDLQRGFVRFGDDVGQGRVVLPEELQGGNSRLGDAARNGAPPESSHGLSHGAHHVVKHALRDMLQHGAQGITKSVESGCRCAPSTPAALSHYRYD